ncbi:MAG TPA: hypothetical protein VGM74_05415 [Burkholderiaceae bacterium]|jgi:hypothetical protein
MQNATRERLIGRYCGLTRELARAYDAVPWRAGTIDRLADEIASTEQQLVALGAVDASMTEEPPCSSN